MPAVQNAMVVEDRVGDDGDKQADKAADDRPEGQYHTDEHEAEIKLDAGGHGRQVGLGVASQIQPGDGDEADGFGEKESGQGRQKHIEESEHQADHRPDGKHPPLPVTLFILG